MRFGKTFNTLISNHLIEIVRI